MKKTSFDWNDAIKEIGKLNRESRKDFDQKNVISFTREWKNVKNNPPIESNRYWCLVEEINDLGNSYFQWNCYFDN